MSDAHLPGNVARRLRGVLGEAEGLRLGQLAVHQGFITPQQLAQALVDQAEKRRQLGEVLVERGWVRPEQLKSLVETQAAEIRARQTQIMSRKPVGSQHQLDEYMLVSSLGRGGMAEVWKAWDSKLHRWVAIKIPTGLSDSGFSLDRFQREAQAAARLTHPNIIPIYRVAQQGATPYIVMRFIEGKTLDQAGVPLKQIADVIRRAALAVHYAHTQGVVHRDLKPTNIMVDAAGEVWVLDFGLAHLRENCHRLTTAGTLIGTPAYMSPEQAQGLPEALTPSSDIYSLGATLYWMATRHPPFSGETVPEIVHKVSEEDPVPPRALEPLVDRRLELIILKAMAKEPVRRYVSAAALAEDLRRFIEDEPISARPESWVGRCYRKARKHRLVVTLAGLLLVAALTTAWLGWSGASDRAEALDVLRSIANMSVERALEFRRAGKNDALDALLPPLTAAYEAAVKRAPNEPEPYYLMGRMYRALMMPHRALEFQNQAIAKNPNFLPAVYERAIVASVLYDSMCKSAGLQYDAQRADSIERMIPQLKSLRVSIEKDCRTLGSNAEFKAARGILLTFQPGELDQAEKILRAVVEEDPLKDEAWEALAQIAHMRANRSKGPAERIKHWSQAETDYSDALSKDKGYSPFRFGRGAARLYRGMARAERGENPEHDYDEADDDFKEALKRADEFGDYWSARALVARCRGSWLVGHGKDPLAQYDKAEQFLEESLKRRQNIPQAMRLRGHVRSARGVYLAEHGADPSKEYAGALEDFAKAEPQSLEAKSGIALVLWRRGMESKEHGLDPLLDWLQAEKELQEVLKLDPDAGWAWAQRGKICRERAGYLMGRSQDPSADLDAAERYLAEALRCDPEFGEALLWRGWTLMDRGIHDGEAGADPMPTWDRAQKDIEEALRLNPNYLEARRGLAQLLWNRGTFDLQRGVDPRALFARAEQQCSLILEENPRAADAWLTRGQVRMNRGAYMKNHGGDPMPDWAEAEDDVKSALEINGRLAAAFLVLGEIRGNRAIQLYDTGVDPSAQYRDSEEAFQRGLALNPEVYEGWMHLAHTYSMRALCKSNTGENPAVDFDEAEKCYARALKITGGRRADVWVLRGQMRVNRAGYHFHHGGDAAADYEEAEKDFTRATELEPKRANGWYSRGTARMNRGAEKAQAKENPIADWEAGEKDLSEALRLDKNDSRFWIARGMLRANRAMFLADTDQDPLPGWAQGEADLTEGLRLNPKDTQGWYGRGLMRWYRAQHREKERQTPEAIRDYDGAAQDWERVVKIDRSMRDSLSKRIEEAKARAAKLADY